MMITRRAAVVLFAFFLAAGWALPAGAADVGVKIGTMTCKTLPDTKVSLFLRHSVAIECTFKAKGGEEHYKGELGFLGVDLGKKSAETLSFAVLGVAKGVEIGKYALTGDYAGATLGAGLFEKGYGTTQLVGGFNKGFSLVPSLDTFHGSGITAGTTRMHIEKK